MSDRPKAAGGPLWVPSREPPTCSTQIQTAQSLRPASPTHLDLCRCSATPRLCRPAPRSALGPTSQWRPHSPGDCGPCWRGPEAQQCWDELSPATEFPDDTCSRPAPGGQQHFRLCHFRAFPRTKPPWCRPEGTPVEFSSRLQLEQRQN